MRDAKIQTLPFRCSTARSLHALARAIAVRTPIDAKVVDLFHQAAVMAESARE